MGLQIYKPNKSVKGALAHFTFNSKDQAFYLTLIRQTGEKSFKGGQKVNIKFNVSEVGGLLRSLDEQVEVKFYHKSQDKSTSIQFGPYKLQGSEAVAGFGLSIIQGEDKFRIPFTLDEGYLLEEYLRYALLHCFDALYSEDVQRAKEYAAKKKTSYNPNSDENRGKPAPKADDDGFNDDGNGTEARESDDEPIF